MELRPAAAGITDELDNQVITQETESETKPEPQPVEAEETELSEEDKRKQIGDEFYQEAEAESLKAENIEVKVTGSIIAVTSEVIPVTGTFSLQTDQEAATEELGHKLEEQLLTDSPPANTSPSPPPVSTGATIISFIQAPDHGILESRLFQEDLSGQTGQPPQLEPEEPMVVSYAGGVTVPVTAPDSLYSALSAPHMMTATTETVLDSVLVSGLVKNEPEDLTGQRHRHGSDITLDVTAKLLDKSGMGLVTSPDGDSHIILNTEDLPLAPGFTTTTTGYDPPSFYSSSEAGARLYGAPETAGGYRDQDLYGEPGYQGRGGGQSGGQTYSLYPGSQGLSVDLPSPDSGLGSDQITPKGFVDGDSSFDYTQNILNDNTIPRKPWHDYGSRNSDTEKVQIPKVYSPYGFHYMLDAATSSSVRREDDKVTYINKGQFYGVTLEYTPDPEQSLKSATVKSVIMLVFRDGKSVEEEQKAWQFWHQRQHSIKQRIIDVDTKNSIGLLGHIEELSHNALAVYWNPLESPAKVNLAIQCLSTDFSTQKGVKGLPLHVQIDTYDDPRADVSTPPTHRGYSQVKIFCDKGAERKLRDEERRAAKRRMTPSGKRRLDEMYHETFERTEFYAMSDLTKPSTLFTPPEDPERSSQISSEFPSFYTPQQRPAEVRHLSNISNGSDLLPALMTGAVIEPKQEPPFPVEKSSAKRARLVPPVSERIMIYVRQETEDVYTPLHLVPPTVQGLIGAIENKYKISATNIRFLYRKNKDGIVAKVDDDMLRHYCNEDVFLMQVMVTEGPAGEDTSVYDITLSEIHQHV